MILLLSSFRFFFFFFSVILLIVIWGVTGGEGWGGRMEGHPGSLYVEVHEGCMQVYRLHPHLYCLP